MPPRDRLQVPDLPGDTAPVGPCAPFESPDDGPPPVLLPEGPPPDAAGDDMAAKMAEAIAALEEELQKMADGFNAIVSAVRRFADIGMLGPEIVEAARVVLEKLREILEAAIDVVMYIMEHYAPLAALSLTSFNWLSHVKEPMTGLKGLVLRDGGENLIQWKGEAAEKYHGKVVEQHTAVDHIGALGGDFSVWLREVFEANLAYTTPLRDLLARLAGMIGQAAVKAGSGFGIPDAINVLKDGLGEIIETAAKYLLDAVDRVVKAIGKSHDLLNRLSDDTKLPGGAWPQAVRN